MTVARARWWLAIAALVLGAAAALVRVAPSHARAAAPASIYKPPSGC